MMTVTTRRLTWEDLCALPEDGDRYEIIDGELYVMPPPATVHQSLSMKLSSDLYVHVAAHDLGKVWTSPIGVRLAPHDIVEPDIVFVAKKRLGIVAAHAIEGAPDLVMEILSPSTRLKDRQRKAALYLAAGVREYWLIEPRDQAIEVLVARGGGYQSLPKTGGTVRLEVVAGFTVDVPALFAAM